MSNELLTSQSSRTEQALVISLWALAAGGAFFSLAFDYPGSLLLCSILYLYIAAICLHEYGHAVGSKLMGGVVHYIQLGRRYSDQPCWKLNFLGFTWQVYSSPLSGSVHSSFYTTERFRLRRCVVIGMGPLFNLLAALCCLPFLLQIDFNQVTCIPALLLGWAAVNGYLFATSARPQIIRHQGQRRPNDGLLFWKTLFYSDEDIHAFVKHALLTRDFGEDNEFAKTLTTSELLTKYVTDPTRYVYLWYLVCKLEEEKDPRHSEYLIKLVNYSEITAEQKMFLIDNFLTNQLAVGPPIDPDISDRLSLQLLDGENSVTARGTRGSVLIDLGRIDEGKSMLQGVLEKTSSTIDKAYSHIFLALAAKQEGHLELAREHAEEAAKIDPMCAALKRVSDLLPTKSVDGKELKVGGHSTSSDDGLI